MNTRIYRATRQTSKYFNHLVSKSEFTEILLMVKNIK